MAHAAGLPSVHHDQGTRRRSTESRPRASS